MGEAVLKDHAEVAEVHLSLPNRHHILVDLSPFGLENSNEDLRRHRRAFRA